jgi:hypothetical protein
METDWHQAGIPVLVRGFASYPMGMSLASGLRVVPLVVVIARQT